MQQGRLVPWLYVTPAFLLIIVFVVYPTIYTGILSFRDRTGEQPASVDCVPNQPCWGIFENYRYALTNEAMTTALKNNALWLILMVPATIAFGLLIAVLADRVKYESLVKVFIFMPMAISFIGAGVIWQFMYAIVSGGGSQIGVLNAIVVGMGGKPIPWLSTAVVNNRSDDGRCMVRLIQRRSYRRFRDYRRRSRQDDGVAFQVFRKIMPRPLRSPSS
jgi:alpha-glucoside transport system permease protein